MTRFALPPQRLRTLRKGYSHLLALLGGVLVPLSLFAILAVGVLRHDAFAFDEPMLRFMHSNANALWDESMLMSSRLGSGLWVTSVDALVLLALIVRRRWRLAWFWGFAVGGAAMLNFAAKRLFARMRPDLWQSIAPETTFSFPSAHAMQTMALVLALVVLSWSTRWRGLVVLLGTAFVVLVGLSRIYLGVHYPSDVLAGWLVSVAWVSAVTAVMQGQLDRLPMRHR